MRKLNESKKYDFYGEPLTINFEGKTFKVNRIRALKDIPSIGVKKFDLGGLVYSENSLSQKDDCWVFVGGTVHTGGRVLGNAQVKGLSLIALHSVVKGNCLIEDTEVLNDCFIGGDATVKDSHIHAHCVVNGTIAITKSELRNIVMMNGTVIESNLEATDDRLHISEKVDFIQTHLITTDAEAKISAECQFTNVHCGNFRRFQVNGNLKMENVNFPLESKFTIRAPEDRDTTCIIVSEGGQCELKELDLTLEDTNITGAVTLIGNIDLCDVELFDMAVVKNQTRGTLFLDSVRLNEFAEIHKVGSNINCKIHNEIQQGETIWKC